MLQLRPTPFTSAVRGANLRSVRGAVLVSRAQKGFASDAKVFVINTKDISLETLDQFAVTWVCLFLRPICVVIGAH